MIKNIIYGLLSVCIGTINGFITNEKGIWWNELIKPNWQPEGWVFGVAWTILYFLIGLAGYRIHRCDNKFNKLLFWTQLIFNHTWSFIFFKMQDIELALIDLSLLLCTVGFLLFRTYKDKIMLSTLLPYFLWLIFAFALNYKICDLNVCC